jgi:hypothetical protein
VRHTAAFLNDDWNVAYFVNPTLYTYLLYAATCITGNALVVTGHHESFDDFIASCSLNVYPILVTGRILNILLSTASVALLFLFARRLFSFPVAALASMTLALNLTHAFRAPVVGTETLMVFLVLVFFNLLWRYHENPSWKMHLLCGFILGAACSTKYNAAIHGIPFILVTVLAAIKTRSTGSLLSWFKPLVTSPRFNIGFLFVIIGFVACSPYTIMNFDRFISIFARQYTNLDKGFVAREAEINQTGFEYYPVHFADKNNGIIFAILCGVGILWAIYRAIRYRDQRSMLLLSAIVPLYVFFGSGVCNVMRFLLPSIPFILILGAWMFVELTTVIRRRLEKHITLPPWAWNGLWVTVALILLLPSAVYSRATLQKTYGDIDPRRDITLWLIENLERDDSVLLLDLTKGDPFMVERENIHKYGHRWNQVELNHPFFTPIFGLIETSSTLDELIDRINAGRFDYFLVILHMSDLLILEELPKSRHNAVLNACSYWNDLVFFLASLTKKYRLVSHDNRILMMLYELPPTDEKEDT